MPLTFHPTVDDLWGDDTAPRWRDGNPQPAHWAWPTVGGHRELRRDRWVIVDVVPNPAYWGGEQPW